MSTLYELAGELEELYEMADSGEHDEQAVKDTLEGVEFETAEKVDGYGKLIRCIEADAEALKAEAARLEARRRAKQAAAERLKAHMKECIDRAGCGKLEGQVFSFSVRSGAPQLPKDLDPARVPAEYLKPQPPKIDRAGLLKAVKAGDVGGIELERGTSLVMR